MKVIDRRSKIPITWEDIHVYLTLEGSYRIYVKNSPSIPNFWSYSKSSALKHLARYLLSEDISFDFSDAPWSTMNF